MLEECQVLKPLIRNFLRVNNDHETKSLKDELLKTIKTKLYVSFNDFFLQDRDYSILVFFEPSFYQKYTSQFSTPVNKNNLSGSTILILDYIIDVFIKNQANSDLVTLMPILYVKSFELELGKSINVREDKKRIEEDPDIKDLLKEAFQQYTRNKLIENCKLNKSRNFEPKDFANKSFPSMAETSSVIDLSKNSHLLNNAPFEIEGVNYNDTKDTKDHKASKEKENEQNDFSGQKERLPSALAEISRNEADPQKHFFYNNPLNINSSNMNAASLINDDDNLDQGIVFDLDEVKNEKKEKTEVNANSMTGTKTAKVSLNNTNTGKVDEMDIDDQVYPEFVLKLDEKYGDFLTTINFECFEKFKFYALKPTEEKEEDQVKGEGMVKIEN